MREVVPLTGVTQTLPTRCLSAAACGYVLKDSPPAQLVYAIRAAHKGEQYISPRALRGLLR